MPDRNFVVGYCVVLFLVIVGSAYPPTKTAAHVLAWIATACIIVQIIRKR